MPKQSSAERRRKQNREAQRRFRQKQAKLALQSKRDFEDLESKYEALVAFSRASRQMPLEGADCSSDSPDDDLPSDACLDDRWSAAESELSLGPFYVDQSGSAGVSEALPSSPVMECVSPSADLAAMLDVSPELGNGWPEDLATEEIVLPESKPSDPTQTELSSCNAFPVNYSLHSGTDVMQAMIQIMYTQERIAQIELQKLQIVAHSGVYGFIGGRPSA